MNGLEPSFRRPLDRVALELIEGVRANGRSPVVGMTSLVDAPELVGRAIELSRLVGIHGALPVALVEANLRNASRLAASLGMDAAPGLASTLAHPEKACAVVRPTPDPRLYVMTSGVDGPAARPPSADALARIATSLRTGQWVKARAVVDIEHAEDVTALTPARVASASLPPAEAPDGLPPPPPYAGVDPAPDVPWVTPPSNGGGIRPFNEGPSDAPQRVPAVAGTTPARAASVPDLGGRAGRGPTVTVVLAPPLDDLTDGDVVARQCDELVLVVHAGRSSRDQVAEAVERCGASRVIGTVLVTEKRRARRAPRRSARP